MFFLEKLNSEKKVYSIKKIQSISRSTLRSSKEKKDQIEEVPAI